MADLSAFPNRWDRKKCECCAIIETPKNRRNKFDYDPESNLFKLGGLLPEGMMFPFDFGFIPSTLGEDGDPLDVMVLMDEPAHVGCLLDVRVIGVIEAKQTQDGETETNDRLLAVAIHSYQHQNVSSLQQLNPVVSRSARAVLRFLQQAAWEKVQVGEPGRPQTRHDDYQKRNRSVRQEKR